MPGVDRASLFPPGANRPFSAPGNRFFPSPGANQPLSAPGSLPDLLDHVQEYDYAPEWDFVFFLGFLNFDMPHLPGEVTDPGRFIHKFSLREDETHEQLSRAMRFAFLEVARFDKAQEECESFEDRFLYLMKNLPTFVEEPELWNDPYFEESMEEATSPA